MIRAPLLAALLLGSVAGSAAAGVAAADQRGYELRNQDVKKPAPLIVALHCYGCPPAYATQLLGLDGMARRHGALLAIPAGYTDARGKPFWNATTACCDFDGKKPDDVAYVARVIDDAIKTHGADPRRVYLVGISNGGFLAYRMACERSATIAALVSIGGAAPATCRPTSPVAVLEAHGEHDDIVPVAGGPIGGSLPRLAPVPSAHDTLETWARVDQCAAPDAAGHRRCRHGAVEQWMLPGGHIPDFDAGFGERLWQWLSAQHR